MAFKYFSKLPIIEYPLNETTNKKARDVLHRIFFDQKYIGDSDYFTSYLVSDGDRPEVIANKLYQRPDLHSVIMLINEFDVSMLNGLPPTSSIYEEYINEKYSDNVYYLKPIVPSLTYLSSAISVGTGGSGGISGGYVYPIFGHGFNVGEKIFGTDSANFQNYNTRAYVKEWNPIMCSLKLDILNGSFVPGLTLSSSDGRVNFIISKVLSGPDAVHHFETPTTISNQYQPIIKGSLVDPLSSYSIPVTGDARISPIGIVKNGFTGDYARSVIYRHNADLQTTLLSKYVRAVSNREYEERMLTKKRTIKIPSRNDSIRTDLINKISDLLESSNG